MNNIQERLVGTGIAPVLADVSAAADGTARQMLGSPIGRIGTDAINVLRRPMTGMMTGGAMGIVSQLLGIIQQLLSSFGFGAQASSVQRYYANATASSTGDPHLAFDGTDGSGNARHARFDSMQGHSDLLDSASFAGGFRISTGVTQPGANGVTYNREATVSTNFGNTRVTLDNQGNAGIVSNGRTFSLTNGQTVDVGNGETVTRNADGSLSVTDDNGLGGSVTTRLSENGAGVDVNVQAQNVDLGGDLVSAGEPQTRRVM
jgi:hypothetical protein